MQRLKSHKLVFVDIDNTLAIWKGDEYYPHKGYIELIKRFHRRGHKLIAWSAGGEAWANKVVKRFHLEKYFYLSMSKPDWYMDDLKSEEFLPEINRIFLEKEEV